MQDTRFWRIVAVLAVMALFYVGHGLHTGPPPEVLSGGVARADGIMTREDANAIFTTNADGTQINVWRQTGPYSVEHKSSVGAQ